MRVNGDPAEKQQHKNHEDDDDQDTLRRPHALRVPQQSALGPGRDAWDLATLQASRFR